MEWKTEFSRHSSESSGLFRRLSSNAEYRDDFSQTRWHLSQVKQSLQAKANASATSSPGEDLETLPEFAEVLAVVENSSVWKDVNISRSRAGNASTTLTVPFVARAYDASTKRRSNYRGVSKFTYALFGLIGCVIMTVLVCTAASSLKDICTNALHGTRGRILDRVCFRLS